MKYCVIATDQTETKVTDENTLFISLGVLGLKKKLLPCTGWKTACDKNLSGVFPQLKSVTLRNISRGIISWNGTSTFGRKNSATLSNPSNPIQAYTNGRGSVATNSSDVILRVFARFGSYLENKTKDYNEKEGA